MVVVFLCLKKLPNVSVRSVSMSSTFCDTEILAIDTALSDFADGSPRLCVFGDFNLPLFNWDMFIYPDNFLYRNAAFLVS